MPQKKRIVELLEVGDYVDLEPALKEVWNEKKIARCEEHIRNVEQKNWNDTTLLWFWAKVRFLEVRLVFARKVMIGDFPHTGLEFTINEKVVSIALPSELVVELLETYDVDEEIT